MYGVASLFGLVFIFNAIYIYLAVSTHRGEIEGNAYEAGLAYQQVIDAEQRARELNWEVAVSVEKQQDVAEKLIKVRLLDEEGKAVANRKLRLRLFVPAEKNFDVELLPKESREGEAGVYSALALLPAQGLLLTEIRDETRSDALLWKRRVYY